MACMGPLVITMGKHIFLSGSVCAWTADFTLNTLGAPVLAKLSSNAVMQPDWGTETVLTHQGTRVDPPAGEYHSEFSSWTESLKVP